MKKLLFRGPLLTSSGYGVHARQLLAAILRTKKYDVSVASINWGNTSFVMMHDRFFDLVRQLSKKFEEERQSNVQYDVSVQCTIPNEFEKLAAVNIGVTAGIEVNIVSPDWLVKTNDKVDLLVVPSHHSRDAFTAVAYRDQSGKDIRLMKPLAVCPEGVDTSVYNTKTLSEDQASMFDFPSDFNFLFVGLGLDKPMGEDRKNLSLLIKLFCERFKDDKSVGLVLKAGVVNHSLMDFESITRRIKDIKKSTGCGEFPRIHLVHGRLSDDDMSVLYRHPKIKAMISLTHGEGFGLPLLEAAACGLPVVATSWSGHTDFLTIDGKKKYVPLEYDLKEIPESSVWKGVMEKGTKWAYPKEDDVKLKMKKLILSYDKPKEWALELAQHIARNYSLERVCDHFANTLDSFLTQHVKQNPQSEAEAAGVIKERFDQLYTGKRLLYTMPMSAGDVYISTAIVSSLRKKFPEHKIFFAVDQKYSSILKDNPNVDFVVQWEQWMMNVPLCEKIFDEVYTPNVAIQLMNSNWVHGGKGRLLGNEMANHCDVEFGDYFIKTEPVDGLPEKYIVFNPGSGKGQWEARNYLHWQEVVENLGRLSGLPIIQVGMPDDPEYKGTTDFRGKTDYNQLAHVVKNAKLVVGIDSVTSHLAAGFDVPQVSIYGSSYSTSTGPVQKKKLAVLLDTPSRYTCDKACYKYQCSVDKDHPCVNEIPPKLLVIHAMGWMHPALGFSQEKIDKLIVEGYVEYRPKISGYTHILNPESHEFPYLQSIRSMLGFCDEVVVVDGGSDDGSVEKIKALGDERVKVIERKWDWDEPGMDGMQKAFGRAMCSGDFLWQQDADEIIHEEDYEKIRKLVKRFPKAADLLHLPVVELWGDDRTVRTDRHSWKWRLSRNNFRITHGINKDARLTDEKTGKTYAKKGMSDGCEYVDVMDHTYIRHMGFYSAELEKLRLSNPQAYGEQMNKIFEELPSVFHYSWANLPRKIRNFKKFWNRCWSNLYNDPSPVDRFPDVEGEESIPKKVEELKGQGGEHGKAITFQLRRTSPAVMRKAI